MGIGCYVHDGCINSLSYADDMVLLALSADALQDLIDVYQVYVAKHDIVYNTTNTKCMVVLPPHSKVNYPESAQLSGRALTFVDRFTYLGHVLHRDMTDDADIKFTVTGNTCCGSFPTVAWKWNWNYSGVTATLFTATLYVRGSRWLLWTVLGYVTTTSLRGFWGYPDGPALPWPSPGMRWKVWCDPTICSAWGVRWHILRIPSSLLLLPYLLLLIPPPLMIPVIISLPSSQCDNFLSFIILWCPFSTGIPMFLPILLILMPFIHFKHVLTLKEAW